MTKVEELNNEVEKIRLELKNLRDYKNDLYSSLDKERREEFKNIEARVLDNSKILSKLIFGIENISFETEVFEYGFSGKNSLNPNNFYRNNKSCIVLGLSNIYSEKIISIIELIKNTQSIITDLEEKEKSIMTEINSLPQNF